MLQHNPELNNSQLSMNVTLTSVDLAFCALYVCIYRCKYQQSNICFYETLGSFKDAQRKKEQKKRILIARKRNQGNKGRIDMGPRQGKGQRKKTKTKDGERNKETRKTVTIDTGITNANKGELNKSKSRCFDQDETVPRESQTLQNAVSIVRSIQQLQHRLQYLNYTSVQVQ